MTDYVKMIPKLIARTEDPDALIDAFDLCRELELEGSTRVLGSGKRDRGVTIYDDDNFAKAHEYAKQIRNAANALFKRGMFVEDMLNLYYKTHLFDAPHFFDSFCIGKF